MLNRQEAQVGDYPVVASVNDRRADNAAGANVQRVELLAPAGGRSQLEAAVRFGANAVYLAADRFGMRARADNFSLDDIASAVAFAHAHDVNVHVTLNILMGDDDIKTLPAYCEALDDAGVDAFIIGDLGAFSIAREYSPHVDLHVSTQASVMNAAAARMWHDLGAARVVCAREMSVEDIATMRAHTPSDLEIEAFVHGAMCMAYSGRCLLSAGMTGRSGNKGACAQSCRWSYALVEEKRPGEYFPIEEDQTGSFILNAQDLNMVEHLGDLIDAGVSSLKIEGRNKRAFYVATVVHAYRSALDGGDIAAARDELLTISHRPYSTGFYYGRATQSPEQDGYVKECVHVATVEACEQVYEASSATRDAHALQSDASGTNTGSWKITVSCHNGFEEGGQLELLSPFAASEYIYPRNIVWLAPADGGKPFVERGRLSLEEVRALSVPVPVAKANRSRERYVFYSDKPLAPGDYLRRRI